VRKKKLSIRRKLQLNAFRNDIIYDYTATGSPAVVLKRDAVVHSINTPGWPVGKPLPQHNFDYYNLVAVDPVGTFFVSDWDGINLMWVPRSSFKNNIAQLIGLYSPYSWDTWNNEIANAACRKAVAKVSNSHANLGEFMGEVHKTSSMFYDLVKRFSLAFLSLKKLDVRGAYHALDLSINDAAYASLSRQSKTQRARANPFLFAGNAWLMLHYGLVPLIDDLVGTATLLYDKFSETPPITKVRASPLSTVYEFSAHGVSANLGWSKTARVELKASCTLEVKLINESLATCESLGISNLPRTAWNLLPYSFVVDKFVNIDRFLGQLTAGLGYELLSGSVTITNRFHGRASISGQVSANHLEKVDGTTNRNESGRFKERRLLYDWPSQSLWDQEGTVLARANAGYDQQLTHVASASALLLQLMSNVFLKKDSYPSPKTISDLSSRATRASTDLAQEAGWIQRRSRTVTTISSRFL